MKLLRNILSLGSLLLLTACQSSGGNTLAEPDQASFLLAETDRDEIDSGDLKVVCDYSHDFFNDDPSINSHTYATWNCGDSLRGLSANGIPDHSVGSFPNAGNPHSIAQQSIDTVFPLAPALVHDDGEDSRVFGFVLNGIKLDPATAGRCDDSGDRCSLAGGSGRWNIEALGQDSFDFGDDHNHAHVQPDGSYHYHGMPEGFLDRQGKGEAMTLTGFAGDGFPIYARYGLADPLDENSEIIILQSSYRLKASPDDGRPSIDRYAMGAFTQDYEYIDGLGDLDECNGRYGVTPEYPNGIYHYTITDSWPYIGRCLKGEPDASFDQVPVGP